MQPEIRLTLDIIYENWADSNKRLTVCIAPLTNEQFSLQPAPGQWPLGQVVQHIISVRAGWFTITLQETSPLMNEYAEWGQPDSPERRAAEFVQGLDETWTFIESCLKRWTPADAAKIFPDEGEDGQVYEVSRGWVIYHVLEHDLHHGSEVSMILGMNGLQPLDI
jgi:uncharacterized damage-inducible protein DinB